MEKSSRRSADGSGISKNRKSHGSKKVKRNPNVYSDGNAKRKHVSVGGNGKNQKNEFHSKRKPSTQAERIQAMKDNKYYNQPDVVRPAASELDLVLIPIFWRNKTGQRELVLSYTEDCIAKLQAAGLRAWADTGHRKLPGSKMAYWENAGIRLRVEIGPTEAEQKHYVLAKVTEPGTVADKQTFYREDFELMVATIKQALQVQHDGRKQARAGSDEDG